MKMAKTEFRVISPVESFIADVEKAFEAVQKDYFVTFGIKPRSPSSAYGYIQIDELKPSSTGGGGLKLKLLRKNRIITLQLNIFPLHIIGGIVGCSLLIAIFFS